MKIILFSLCVLPYFCFGQNVVTKKDLKKDRPNFLLAISDDQSWVHAGAYGDKVIKTPAFDRLAKNGVLFTYAFCSSPSCTPSRASVLTGQDFWRLEEGSELFGTLPAKFATYTELLQKNGYFVGYMKKGWGPGKVKAGGRTNNPAGLSYASFDDFISNVPKGTPWCFWYGPYDPHRPYELGKGKTLNIEINEIEVPGFLPDSPVVKSDIADYYYEIQRYDNELNGILKSIKENDYSKNTLIVATSDNGMPFPRSKANLYDFGVRMPLVINWGDHIIGGRKVNDFVNLTDFAPTFLEAADIEIPVEMTGKSLMNILKSDKNGLVDETRDFVVVGRERHAWCRANGLGYPSRMIRTKDYLYVRNYHNEREPAGDPTIITNEGSYGDIDASPTKSLLISNKTNPNYNRFFKLSFGIRPDEELYDCRNDKYQTNNLAQSVKYRKIKKSLAKKLKSHLLSRKDPRAIDKPIIWEDYKYYGRNDWETNPGMPVENN